MRRLIWIILLAATGAARGQNAPLPRPPAGVEPAPFPGVTAELQNLTLREAADKVAPLVGLPLELPDPPGTERQAGEGLDYSRRARFSWKGAPLAQVLRDFCRAYGCHLEWGEDGAGYAVRPGALPSGPQCRLNGYAVEVTLLTFDDDRSQEESSAALLVTRNLGVEFAIRAASGDPSAIQGLENVRVVDDQGRDATGSADDPASDGREEQTAESPFPDEQRGYYQFDWPYPVPHRLRWIEGDVVLYRRVQRAVVEIPVPEANQPSVGRSVGEVQVRLVSFTPGGPATQYSVHVTSPPGLDVAFAGGMPQAALVLKDGTRVPAVVREDGMGSTDGNLTAEYLLSVPEAKEKPAKVALNLVMRSDPSRRLHFRFDNYPQALGPAPPSRSGAAGAGKAAGPARAASRTRRK